MCVSIIRQDALHERQNGPPADGPASHPLVVGPTSIVIQAVKTRTKGEGLQPKKQSLVACVHARVISACPSPPECPSPISSPSTETSLVGCRRVVSLVMDVLFHRQRRETHALVDPRPATATKYRSGSSPSLWVSASPRSRRYRGRTSPRRASGRARPLRLSATHPRPRRGRSPSAAPALRGNRRRRRSP